MNSDRSALVQLPADNLFGVEHLLRYFAYRREFSGRCDAAGEPIFEAAAVRPHPEQRFEGLWVPHPPMKGVVLDTGLLSLAFYCPAILRHPLDPLHPPRLRIEAVQGRGGPSPEITWRIFQYPRPHGNNAHTLDPPLDLAPSNTGSCWVTPAEARDFLADEQHWVRRQRQELLPRPGQDLSPANLRQAACLDLLGSEYFRVVSNQWNLEDMLRVVDTGVPDPDVIVVSPTSRAEIIAALERHAPRLAEMAALSHYPKLQPALLERADGIAARYAALTRRLDRLERLQHKLNLGPQRPGTSAESFQPAAITSAVVNVPTLPPPPQPSVPETIASHQKSSSNTKRTQVRV